jgi:hypothetical protein
MSAGGRVGIFYFRMCWKRNFGSLLGNKTYGLVLLLYVCKVLIYLVPEFYSIESLFLSKDIILRK